jgi:hypothetical protein
MSNQFKKVRSFPRIIEWGYPHPTIANEFVNSKFSCRFMQFSTSDLESIQAKIEVDADLPPQIIEPGSLSGISVDGVESPSHEQQLEALLQDVTMTNACINDYFKALKGDPAAKNSKRSRVR